MRCAHTTILHSALCILHLGTLTVQKQTDGEIIMRHLFIINPAAGAKDRTQTYTDTIHAACGKRGLSYQIAVSAGPGDISRLAREAAETGEEYRIYACGGDGTLNEVVQGAAGHPNASVTVFSGGSGNDFAKIFSDPSAFFDLERLLDAEEAEFDLIRCNDDFALNICCVGLDARIGNDVANYKRLPFLHGFWAYAASTVVNIIRGISEHYVVEINGETVDRDETFVCICNGRYYGGGFNPIPDADPADGMLDVLLVKKISRLQIPGIIGKYKNGQYKELSSVATYYRTDKVKVICDKPTYINLDGEIRNATVAEFSVAQEKLRFFYPRGLTWAAREPATV